MTGAREHATGIPTGQYGRLYCVSSNHARGLTFDVYVLPAGEKAEPNGACNPPLNSHSVHVYGPLSGQLVGWSEAYGVLVPGPWIDDLHALYIKHKRLRDAKLTEAQVRQAREEEDRCKKEQETLSTYTRSIPDEPESI